MSRRDSYSFGGASGDGASRRPGRGGSAGGEIGSAQWRGVMGPGILGSGGGGGVGGFPTPPWGGALARPPTGVYAPPGPLLPPRELWRDSSWLMPGRQQQAAAAAAAAAWQSGFGRGRIAPGLGVAGNRGRFLRPGGRGSERTPTRAELDNDIDQWRRKDRKKDGESLDKDLDNYWRNSKRRKASHLDLPADDREKEASIQLKSQEPFKVKEDENAKEMGTRVEKMAGDKQKEAEERQQEPDSGDKTELEHENGEATRKQQASEDEGEFAEDGDEDIARAEKILEEMSEEETAEAVGSG